MPSYTAVLTWQVFTSPDFQSCSLYTVQKNVMLSKTNGSFLAIVKFTVLISYQGGNAVFAQRWWLQQHR